MQLISSTSEILDSENQWYWNGATRENIDEITIDYFTEWVSNNNDIK